MYTDQRRSMGRIIFVMLIFVSSFPPIAVAARIGGSFPDFEWGARQKATRLWGVAFDDAFAPLHNPAALRACGERHVALEQMRPFGVPVTAVAWCGSGGDFGVPESGEARTEPGEAGPEPGVVEPLHGWYAVVGGHVIVRQTPAGLGFDYNTYSAAVTGLLKFATENVSIGLGITPKLLLLSISGTDTDHDDQAFGYGADLGVSIDIPVAVRFVDNVSFSIAVLDGLSRLRYGSGIVEAAAEPSSVASVNVTGPGFSTGIAARQTGARTKSRTLEWSIGSEYVIFTRPVADLLRSVALRAGIDFGDGAMTEAGLGVGLNLSNFGIDYSFTWRGQHVEDQSLHAVTTRLYF